MFFNHRSSRDHRGFGIVMHAKAVVLKKMVEAHYTSHFACGPLDIRAICGYLYKEILVYVRTGSVRIIRI